MPRLLFLCGTTEQLCSFDDVGNMLLCSSYSLSLAVCVFDKKSWKHRPRRMWATWGFFFFSAAAENLRESASCVNSWALLPEKIPSAHIDRNLAACAFTHRASFVPCSTRRIVCSVCVRPANKSSLWIKGLERRAYSCIKNNTGKNAACAARCIIKSSRAPHHFIKFKSRTPVHKLLGGHTGVLSGKNDDHVIK